MITAVAVGMPLSWLGLPSIHLCYCCCDRGTDVYLASSSPNYQQSVFTMVQHTLSGDFDELNMIQAVKLMEAVLQNCSGKVRDCSITC